MTKRLEKDLNHKRIIELLEKNSSMNLGNIVKDLGISAEKGLNYMLRLRQYGLVRIAEESKYTLNR